MLSSRPSVLSTILALAALTSAQSTSVTTLNLFDFHGNDISASVVAAGPEATTFVVTCTNTATCDFPPAVTIVDGPSTQGMTYSGNGQTAFANCKIESNTGVCTASGSSSATSASMTGTYTDFAKYEATALEAVTVTAGLDALSSASAAAATATSSGSGTAKETNILLAGIAGILGVAMIL